MPKRQPRTGDVFTFEVGGLHYVLQFIHVVDEPTHSQPPFRFRAHVVVFENGYRAVPERPNLTRIYRIKTRPRGQLLYVLLFGLEPQLPRDLRYWGRMEPTGPWIPAIELSPEMPVKAREVDGVTITPQVARFDYVRGRIADDQRKRSPVAVDPQIFEGWIEAMDGSLILRTETLITDLRARIAGGRTCKSALSTCVRATNRLDAKHGFIGTLEAEDLVEALVAEAGAGGMDSNDAADLIDRLRDW